MLCAGCFAKPGFAGGDGGDAGLGSDADGATVDACMGAWGQPVVVTEFNNKITGEPTITSDLLQVYFAKQVTGTMWEIHSASRSTTTETFTVTTAAPFGTGNQFDQDPAVTDDNQLVVFRLGGSNTVSQAIWTGSNWSISPALNTGVTSLDLSPDGLTLYYAVDGGDLYATTRTDRALMFTASNTAIATGILFPSVTADGLTLYSVDGGTPGTGVAVRTRTSTMSAFGMPTHLFTGAVDPDVTGDGNTMVVSMNGTMMGIATRSCH